MQVTAEQLKAAWQKCEDAWQAVGTPVPCYEENYMAARKKFHELEEKARKQRKKKQRAA